MANIQGSISPLFSCLLSEFRILLRFGRALFPMYLLRLNIFVKVATWRPLLSTSAAIHGTDHIEHWQVDCQQYATNGGGHGEGHNRFNRADHNA